MVEGGGVDVHLSEDDWTGAVSGLLTVDLHVAEQVHLAQFVGRAVHGQPYLGSLVSKGGLQSCKVGNDSLAAVE